MTSSPLVPRAHDSSIFDAVEPSAVREVLRRWRESALPPAWLVAALAQALPDVAAVIRCLEDAARRATEAADDGVSERVREALSFAVDRRADLEEEARLAAAHRKGFDDRGDVDFARRFFDMAVDRSEALSVAAYSLGSEELLERCTAELVAYLDQHGLLGAQARVLDLGCGIGRLVTAIHHRVASVEGVDVSPKMIDAARRRAAAPNVGLRSVAGVALPFADAAFDLVAAIDVVPYVHRLGAEALDAHFAEVARVLAPGGTYAFFNFAYRGVEDEEMRRMIDDAEVRHRAALQGLEVAETGGRPLALWDGESFRLRKPQPTGS